MIFGRADCAKAEEAKAQTMSSKGRRHFFIIRSLFALGGWADFTYVSPASPETAGRSSRKIIFLNRRFQRWAQILIPGSVAQGDADAPGGREFVLAGAAEPPGATSRVSMQATVKQISELITPERTLFSGSVVLT